MGFIVKLGNDFQFLSVVHFLSYPGSNSICFFQRVVFFKITLDVSRNSKSPCLDNEDTSVFTNTRSIGTPVFLTLKIAILLRLLVHFDLIILTLG